MRFRRHDASKHASLGNAKRFKNGRQVAAWLGLVPRQDSSGGKTRLLGISKHGDVYLRTLLIHGARAVLRHLEHRAHRTDDWFRRLLVRRTKNVAAVALANKNARFAWALLVTRIAGTWITCESACAIIPSGATNSWRKISPGWMERIRFLIALISLLVVDDLDVPQAVISPTKADSPLIVDPDTVLPASIAAEFLQPVT